jgi:hypothetical protein
MGACITVFVLNLEKLYFANENRKTFWKVSDRKSKRKVEKGQIGG